MSVGEKKKGINEDEKTGIGEKIVTASQMLGGGNSGVKTISDLGHVKT